MGVNFKELIKRREITFEELSGKTIAVDSHNMLYQFLSTIRSREGALLTDSQGRVTSHLIGLFSRTTALLQKNIKPIFVFDGKAPELKRVEIQRRKEAKEQAAKQYERAREAKDVEMMKKYAARTSVLTRDMAAQAQRLLTLLGLPVVQAPSEGEAQAALIAKQGDAWAVSSQDYDSLLCGAPRLIQNLSIAGRRKKLAMGYVTVKPEIIDLSECLESLGIDLDQMIAVAILIGTDYNPKGVRGIGPKNAIKMVKKHGKNFNELFEDVKWEEETSWEEIFNLVKKIPVTKNYDIEFKPIDDKGVIDFLAGEHNFSKERVKKTLEGLSNLKQKGLGEFL